MKSAQELEMTLPNVFIFRLPDSDEGHKIFAEIGINEDFSLGEELNGFQVDAEDGFNNMEMSTIVLAIKEEEMSCTEVASFEVTDKLTQDPAVVCEMMSEFSNVIPQLVKAYLNGPGQTRQ